MGLLDAEFKYIPAAHTDITQTWRRFGYRPTTEACAAAIGTRALAPFAAGRRSNKVASRLHAGRVRLLRRLRAQSIDLPHERLGPRT